ncbi:Zn-dependent hydrolase [Leptospira sp. GIMC2001]|uniref:Zn-dependent hydrolase n=1 Tax=Leptospira sp. GIMC2001 TaxID=1513297 RepID=UPI00234A5747|nr:Zn-dependent hydrolase [Leptospira sp. GIMC2001]WCL50836.1 Zn-dependent hydrolase [Leptospira sp. GIMC2001]
MNVKVNFDRLKNDIQTLAEIGKSPDRGIYRMAFSPGDIEARKWLITLINKANLESRVDSAGNIFAKLTGADDSKSWIIGSHIDTVPAGGHLDGSLGVLCGIEVLRSLLEINYKPKNSIEVVAFTDEEGRFGGLFGSEAFIGELTPERIHNAIDLSGISITDAMLEIGLHSMDALDAKRNPQTIAGYIELHIEQGPILDLSKIPIGIVEDITGLFKWQVRLTGTANHAGTTPMNMRKDAFQGLAEFSLEIPRILEEIGSEKSVATIGRVSLFPGSANTVPGRVDFSLDVRDTSSEVLQALSDSFRKTISAIARRRGLMFDFEVLSSVTPAASDPKILSAIENACNRQKVKYIKMSSGAAHDAQIMARVTNMGMIFVPSKNGRSHSPAEWTPWEDIQIGADILLETIQELTK